MADTGTPDALSTSLRVDSLFSEVPLFADLGGRSRRRLLGQCVPKTYPAGALLLEEEGTALGLFLIATGRVEVFKTEDGLRVPLGVLGAGDILGEMALFDEGPRSASAEAQEPTECLLLTRSSFRALAQEDPEILWRIVPRLAARLRSTQDQLVSLTGEVAVAAALEGQEDSPAGAAETGGPHTSQGAPSPPRAAVPRRGPCSVAGRTMTAGDLLAAPQAFLAGGAAGAAASARVFAGFLRAFADEVAHEAAEEVSGEDSSGALRGLARSAPRSAFAAGRRVLDEAERVPERMLDRALLELRRTRGNRKGSC